jgi:signal transduction histidine kinase/DNA-binding response OmpR family regulator
MATNNYGLVYLESDYDKAEELFLRAQKIAIENNDLYHIGFTNQNLTSLYYSNKQYKKAEQFGLKTLEVASKLNDAQLILNGNTRLFDVYYTLRNYKKAIKYLQNANAMEDSTYTKENSQIIQNLQAKYEADKRNTENKLLKKDAEISSANIKKRDNLIIFILISLAGVFLTALIYFRLSYIRKGLVEEVREKSKEVQLQAEKLKELDEVKSRFFANISHDLRTPLTLIMGSLERITENKESFTNEASKDLEMASKNSKRLLFLTNEINELNQLENGRLKLELQPIHVNEFVKLITNMFSSATDSKSAALEFASSLKQDVFIDADYNHFERIIYNLLSNALKFTEVGGIIKVTVDLHQNVDPNQVQISVIDNGKGISEKNLPFIFDRFYQSLLNEYNAREGFGIRLALVKELVALHNGTIEARSKENEGSTFIVTCPVIDSKALVINKIDPVLDYDKEWLISNPEVKTKLKIDIPEVQPVNKEKVLIVEDHPEIRDYINDIIGKHYVTRIASDGTQALEILNNEAIDLVATDLMMPWMDGFELIENMKANETFQHFSIMVVSARTNDEDRANVLDMGVNNYLIKPFNSKELLARIDNLIHSKTNEASNLFVNNKGKLQDLEKDLLKKVESLIIKNISNSKLSVLHLADVMAASERHVYCMIKKLADITPFE